MASSIASVSVTTDYPFHERQAVIGIPGGGYMVDGDESIEVHSIHDFGIHPHKLRVFGVDDANISDVSSTFSSSTQEDGYGFTAKTCCGNKTWHLRQLFDIASLEKRFFHTSTILINFPDTILYKNRIKNLHKSIRSVHFLQSPHPRRCCVALKDSTKRSLQVSMFSRTVFGTRFLSVDSNYEGSVTPLADIDPFTLFLDDISFETTKEELIKMFPTSQQISIGYKSKLYYIKRYVFIIYSAIKDAISSFKRINKSADVIVRFRRFSGSARLSTELEIKKCQFSVEDFQTGGPIVTDPGPPVQSLKRNYNVIEILTPESTETIETVTENVATTNESVDVTENVATTNESVDVTPENAVTSNTNVDTQNYYLISNFEPLMQQLWEQQRKLSLLTQNGLTFE